MSKIIAWFPHIKGGLFNPFPGDVAIILYVIMIRILYLRSCSITSNQTILRPQIWGVLEKEDQF